MRLCNISVRPGDHAPFLETHGNSVRLGGSANYSVKYYDYRVYKVVQCFSMILLMYIGFILALNGENKGVNIDGEFVNNLCFAEDIFLCAGTP